MSKPVSKMRATPPQMSHKDGRDHMRMAATGKHTMTSLTCKEVIDFMCEIDAYEYYYDFFLRHFESVAQIVLDAKTKGEKIDPEAINQILGEVALYQNVPTPPAKSPPTDSPGPTVAA